MPDGKVSVKAEFEEDTGEAPAPPAPQPVPERPSAKFIDVIPGKWYVDPIDYVLVKGLMAGISESEFAPDLPTTRAMIVTILYRMEGSPEVSGAKSPYEDVKDGKWYTNAVIWADKNEIVAGYGNGKFGPEDPITREQMAAILYRYVQYKGGGFTGTWFFPLEFNDADKISDWASEAVHWCVMNEIMSGTGNGNFEPGGNATRAQIASTLMRFCENIKNM